MTHVRSAMQEVLITISDRLWWELVATTSRNTKLMIHDKARFLDVMELKDNLEDYIDAELTEDR